MEDKFDSLTLRQAIAVQIFYSSPEDEDLVGKTLNTDSWVEPVTQVEAIIFRNNGAPADEVLEKLIKAKLYKPILERYNKQGATYKMVVIYRNDKGERKEMNLTDAIDSALSPKELPSQIMEFLLEDEKYAFLKE